jgi:alpha-glucosidase
MRFPEVPVSRRRISLVFVLALIVGPYATAQNNAAPAATVSSPNGQIRLLLFAAESATPANSDASGLRYAVEFHGKRLLEESKLGLELAHWPELGDGMHSAGVETSAVDQSYTIPVGKTSSVRDHYNAVRASFQDASGRKVAIEARAYDDGIAFRYAVPEQAALHDVQITHELTEFNFAQDATSYPLILDGYQSSWEDEYQQRLVSGLHSDWVIALPFLTELPGRGWLAITEANIDNYAGMYLRKDRKFLSLGFHADLSPRVDKPGIAVEATTPFTSPWRVLMIGDEPGRLIESNIVLNLNPPSKIADTSWIRAGKSA